MGSVANSEGRVVGGTESERGTLYAKQLILRELENRSLPVRQIFNGCTALEIDRACPYGSKTPLNSFHKYAQDMVKEGTLGRQKVGNGRPIFHYFRLAALESQM